MAKVSPREECRADWYFLEEILLQIHATTLRLLWTSWCSIRTLLKHGRRRVIPNLRDNTVRHATEVPGPSARQAAVVSSVGRSQRRMPVVEDQHVASRCLRVSLLRRQRRQISQPKILRHLARTKRLPLNREDRPGLAPRRSREPTRGKPLSKGRPSPAGKQSLDQDPGYACRRDSASTSSYPGSAESGSSAAFRFGLDRPRSQCYP